MKFLLLIAMLFSFNSVAQAGDMDCSWEAEKLGHYEDKLAKWEFKLKYCRALNDDGTVSSDCTRETYRVRYYTKKAAKWSHRKDVCDSVMEDIKFDELDEGFES